MYFSSSDQQNSEQRQSKMNLFWKRQDFIDKINVQIQELMATTNEFCLKEQHSFILNFLSEITMYFLMAKGKYEIINLEKQLLFAYKTKSMELLADSSAKQQLTPPRNHQFSYNSEISRRHIMKSDVIKNSSSFKIYQDKQQILESESCLSNKEYQQVKHEQLNKIKRQDYNENAQLDQQQKYLMNDQFMSVGYQNQQSEINPHSLEKSYKNNYTFSDFDNQNKISTTNFSEYFDDKNRYRHLKQQNLGLEFVKVKYPTNSYYQNETNMGNQLIYQEEYEQDKQSVNINIINQVNSLVSPQDEQKEEEEDRIQSKNFSFDDMEAYEEKNLEIPEQNKEQLQLTGLDNQRQIQEFEIYSVNKPDLQGSIDKMNIVNNKNKGRVQTNSQQEQQVIINQVNQFNTKESIQNHSNYNQSNYDFNTNQSNIQQNLADVQNNQDQHNNSDSQIVTDATKKPQRKKKEKARSYLKAYYDQMSEDSEPLFPLNKKKKIVKQNYNPLPLKVGTLSSQLIINKENLQKQNLKMRELEEEVKDFNQNLNYREEEISQNDFDSLQGDRINQQEQIHSQEQEEEQLEEDEEEEEESESDESNYEQYFDDGDEEISYSEPRQSDNSNNIPSSKPKRGQYKKYSIKLKKKLLNLLQKGEQPKELSQKYKIPMKNLQRWKVYGAERREGGGRKIMDLNMEIILLEYCIDYSLRGRCRCPRKLIMQKARDFTKEVSKFKGSKGWLDKYSTRTGLSKIMSEYKQLRVSSEGEIFKLVKQKSVEHIRQKIKSANPLFIFTSQQYIRFLEEGISQHSNFWNIQLSYYKFISNQFQQFFQSQNLPSPSQDNFFSEQINNFKQNKEYVKLKQLYNLFGIRWEYLLECLGLFKQINSSSINNSQTLEEQEGQILNKIGKQDDTNSKIIVRKKQELQQDDQRENKQNNNNSVLKNITNISNKPHDKLFENTTENYQNSVNLKFQNHEEINKLQRKRQITFSKNAKENNNKFIQNQPKQSQQQQQEQQQYIPLIISRSQEVEKQTHQNENEESSLEDLFRKYENETID